MIHALFVWGAPVLYFDAILFPAERHIFLDHIRYAPQLVL